MRMQTLREQGYGAKAIVAAYPLNFFLSKPSCQQPEQQSLGERQENWRQAEKFAQHVMVSAGVCFGGKERLHFVYKSAKVDSAYYVGRLLPSLVDDCTRLLPSGYIFQQDGAPAHTARATQNWLQTNCPDFIAKDQWPPNSPNLNPLDYHGGQCWRPITSAIRNQKRSPNWRKSCRWSGTAYLRDQ